MSPEGGSGVSNAKPVVLLVEDEQELADQYVEWLAEDWAIDVKTAVEPGLDELSARPAVVLIGENADEDAEQLRDLVRERDQSVRMAFIGRDERSLEPVEDGPVAWLCDSVSRETLRETVDALSLRVTYDELMAEYYDLAFERARMAAAHDGDTPEDHERFRELEDRLLAIRTALDDVLADLSDHDSYVELCSELRSERSALDDALSEL